MKRDPINRAVPDGAYTLDCPMNPDWQQFLGAQGVPEAEPGAALPATLLCNLGQFGVLRVAGADAQSFLQNMLSNDIRLVDATHAQLSSLNSPKGRMLATPLIWLNGADYMLQLPRALCEPVRKKLGMYVLRAKVSISDAGSDTVMLGLAGTNAQQLLCRQFGALPQLPFDYADFGEAGVLKFSDTRFQINVGAHHAPMLWQSFSQHALPASSACWDWLTLRAGIPVILPQTQEQFVPQMANLELLGGVNFKKGCYPGQEIVARMQYLGKLKKRMYLIHLDGSDGATPQPGDELYGVDPEGLAGGMLVNVQPAPGGGYDALAVMQIASHESLHYLSPQGERVQLLELPYTLVPG